MEVQREQAERFAQLRGLQIKQLFSEMETAAKQGRPLFSSMMKALRAGEAEGLILHKIDRGARNLREWSDITDLIELGIKVHFVQDSIDLETRGGRLTGDMLAAVAADYIRNLREETIKGLMGRLKQGLWPFGAPIGYRNHGKGKPKTIDPITGPLVRQAFELYATRTFTFRTLRRHLHTLGLHTPSGKPISLNSLTLILSNPFYMGLMRLGSTGELFPGIHEPLITPALFQCVQDTLRGRFKSRARRHEHLYRGDLKCSTCSWKLTGETQKGRVYYRCHSATCKGVSIREDTVDAELLSDIHHLLRFTHAHPKLNIKLLGMMDEGKANRESRAQTLRVHRGKLDARLSAATDALLDGLIDKDIFTERKNRLLNERALLDEEIAAAERGVADAPRGAQLYFELLRILEDKAFLQGPRAARSSVRSITSNFEVSGKAVALQWNYELAHVLEYGKSLSCALARDTARTTEYFVKLFMGEEDVPTSLRPADEPIAGGDGLY